MWSSSHYFYVWDFKWCLVHIWCVQQLLLKRFGFRYSVFSSSVILVLRRYIWGNSTMLCPYFRGWLHIHWADLLTFPHGSKPQWLLHTDLRQQKNYAYFLQGRVKRLDSPPSLYWWPSFYRWREKGIGDAELTWWWTVKVVVVCLPWWTGTAAKPSFSPCCNGPVGAWISIGKISRRIPSNN